MSHLDKLNISNRIIGAPERRRKIDTAEYRREKLIANIEEQIELASLSLNKEPMQLLRKRGHNMVAVTPRVWWQITSTGTVLTQIRYNKTALNIGGRGSTLEVAGLKNLPAAYRTVIKAINAGELDQAIASAVVTSPT